MTGGPVQVLRQQERERRRLGRVPARYRSEPQRQGDGTEADLGPGRAGKGWVRRGPLLWRQDRDRLRRECGKEQWPRRPRGRPGRWRRQTRRRVRVRGWRATFPEQRGENGVPHGPLLAHPGIHCQANPAQHASCENDRNDLNAFHAVPRLRPDKTWDAGEWAMEPEPRPQGTSVIRSIRPAGRIL